MGETDRIFGARIFSRSALLVMDAGSGLQVSFLAEDSTAALLPVNNRKGSSTRSAQGRAGYDGRTPQLLLVAESRQAWDHVIARPVGGVRTQRAICRGFG